MGELSLRRYEIRRVLGRGGTGTVYEALDTRTHALVALKAVESSIAEHLFQLKHEFRALAEVQHRNLVHFGELACEDDKWFFTMELVAGSGFIPYVRPPLVGLEPEAVVADTLPRPRSDATDPDLDTDEDEGIVTTTVLQVCGVRAGKRAGRIPVVARERGGPTFDEARVRAVFAQLVDALCALHDAGHVHRDVKPGNVLVTREGRVVLLDFGLVMALAASERTRVDKSGTPAYMAPEQAAGASVGPEADWYALGTMLYETLTGRLPFVGSIDQVLAAKAERDPPAPHSLVADVPADLDALCMELMRRDARARPHVDELRARLGLPARARVLAGEATAFVGRSAERAALRAAWQHVHDGGARAVIIEGEPGVGKSALVQEFLADLPASTVVLSGRCYEQESVPFKGVDSMVDALGAHLEARSDDELAELLAGGVRYLASVFPVLNRVPAIQAVSTEERHVASEAGLRANAFGELARLLAALARRSVLVLFLDDLQWIDGDSLALLERAALPESGTPCLFVATLRGQTEVAPALARLYAGSERIALRGLSADEARALWHELGPDAGEGGLQAHRERAMHEAGGHPLFLAELARAARAGQLDRHAGAHLVDVLWDRIAQRDPVERRFLDIVAVAGAPTPYEILARAAQLDVGDCLTRLGALKAAQLVRVSLVGEARCVEPYHDRIREAIMGHLQGGGGHAADLHLHLGRALFAATAADALPARVFTVVHHLNSARDLLVDAGERVRVAELNLLASREARLATAYKRAHSYARAGLELLGEAGWTRSYALCRDLHLARIEALFLAGDRASALAVFEAARPHMASAEDTAALWAAWVVLETGQGRSHDAVAAGRQALAELGIRMPRRGTMLTVLREYIGARWVQERRPAAQLANLPLLADSRLKGALEILIALAPPLFFTDTNLLTWALLRVARLSMRHGVCDVSSYGIAGYGVVLAGAFGQHQEAAELGKLALALDRRFANPRLAAKLAYVNGGYIVPWVRPYADGKEQLRTAYRLAIKHGDPAYEVYSAAVLSVLTFCESKDLAGVRETAEWARDIAIRRADKDMACMPDVQARHAAALAGHAGSARDLGVPGSTDAELRASLDDATTPIALFYYYFCNAELAYLDGDAARAEQLLAQAHRRKEGIFSIPTTAELCLLDALVAARRHAQVGRAARARLRLALDSCVRKLDAWAESCPHNFAAQAHIARAERARVHGRHSEASERYDRAVAAAREHQAPRREAFALELAAAHAHAQGEPERARALTREAVLAYRRWGAQGKAAELARLGEPG